MKSKFLQLFDLRRDQDDPIAIDAEILKGIQAQGTNLWVLIFAILIASIGLNVNSTAVIIGAMLISPLMGPIIGIGYAAGINDFALIKRALRNLGIFVFISLTTATLYFLVSPLSQAQSELLARTTPTLWDVLIAFFGGAAGIVALTRKEVSNVVPGVAIATALMPPLCTAGYGIATGNLAFFGGAFYLFSINSVFIAFSTLIFVKLLKLPQRGYINDNSRIRARLFIAIAVVATLVPSAVLAYRLVQQELFVTSSLRLISKLDNDNRFVLLAKEISKTERLITLTLGGERPPADLDREVLQSLAAAGITDAKVKIRYSGAEKFDVSLIKKELQKDLYTNTLHQLELNQKRIHALEKENAALKATQFDQTTLLKEIMAQYPEAVRVTVAQGSQAIVANAAPTTAVTLPAPDATSTPPAPQGAVIVYLVTTKPITRTDRARLTDWLQTKFADKTLELFVRTEVPQERVTGRKS